MKLHEWFYDMVAGVCHDREYVFAAFVRHFSAFMSDVLQSGQFAGEGTYVIPGIKSGSRATLAWRLERRLDWMGLNELTVHYLIQDMSSDTVVAENTRAFELSTGEITVSRPHKTVERPACDTH